MLNPNLIQVGSVGGTPIMADVSAGLGSAVPIRVLLTQSYTLACPPGWPSRPGQTGTDSADLSFPKTINAGVTLSLLQPEATALINAGAATLA